MTASFALRLRQRSVSSAPSVSAIPSDELVSTTPGKSALMPSGPDGSAATRARMRALASAVHASVGRSTGPSTT